LHEYPPEIEARIRRECKRFKEPLPKRIAEKPALHFGSALFLNAWFDLDPERDRSKGQGITRASCFQYARDYDLDHEQRDDLWTHIAAMDSAFLEWHGKRTKAKATKGDKGS